MENITSIVSRMKEIEENKKELSNQLREVKVAIQVDSHVLENSLIFKCDKNPLEDLKVAGVDGGLIKQEMHGVDIILTRAVATLFHFKAGKLDSTNYLPEKIPQPEVITLHSLDRHEFEVSSSLLRVEKELNAVLLALDQKPDVLLMDGSIVPHPSDQPANHSKVRKYYEHIISLYNEIYSKAMDNGVLLAGVVEDSRSKTFCQILKERILPREQFDKIMETCTDTSLLYYMLNSGERSMMFSYAKNPKENPGLRFFKLGNQIFSFYLKTATADNPLRIDFLNPGNPIETGKKIGSVVFSLSCSNANYGIPSVIIEADQRAKLGPHDLELVKRTISSKLGPFTGFSELRRNRRPF